MGKPVYLGRLKLYWCDKCNVPLLQDKCGRCGKRGRKVNITPPGEVRIGFQGDLNILKDTLKRQFGFSLTRKIVLFNRVPHYDRMDEIIIDGKIIGNLRYEPKQGFKMSLRMDGAYLMGKEIKRGWIIVDNGAIPFILEGRNLMRPGVLDFSEGIKRGDEIVVMDEKREPVAVGIAKMSSEEMEESERGMAVKIRYKGYGTWENKNEPKIEDIIEANEEHLKKLEERAVKFIRDVKKRYDLPMAVSFSGGKDSLVVLLLALESGESFSTFFLNTGIEFPETVEYVNMIEKIYGINIDRIDAGNAFFEALNHFGPPGRDYRWCCKTCKLGPTTRYILEKYPRGLLTLIGQRRYESMDRMRKGSIWKNEWVPNQISASPIQNWSSLEVWLYILWKKAPINPWYIRGLTRIGCYLCPSSDLADFHIVAQYFDDIKRWFEYLRRYARERNVPEEWAESSWRWREPPKWAGGIRVRREKLEISFEGDEWKRVKFNKEIDRVRAANLLNALPPATWKADKEFEILEDFESEAKSLLIRSQECVGCGICLARCPTDALIFEKGKIKILVEKCIHCLDCLGKCPAEEF